MKADRDAGTQKIFTPWRLDQYSTSTTDKHSVTEETTYGVQGHMGQNHLKSNNDAKPVFSPWDQENYNYLTIKRTILSSANSSDGSTDNGDKISPKGDNPSCEKLIGDSEKESNIGKQQEIHDTDTRTDKSCKSTKELKTCSSSEMYLKEGQSDVQDKGQGHKENSGKLWNYRSMKDNSLCMSTSPGCEPDRDLSREPDRHLSREPDRHLSREPERLAHHRDSTSFFSRKSRKHSVESSDSNTENKENFTSNSPLSDGNYKNPVLFCNYSDDSKTDTFEPLAKLSHVSNVLHNSVENLMQYAEVLYKCKLCTTLPSILTSRDSFLSHVSEEHLPNNDQLKECGRCCLRFGTVEDLRTHMSSEHTKTWEEKPQEKIHKKCQKIPNKISPAFKARDSFKSQKRSPSFLRSDSDDLETGSQKLVEDVNVTEDQETASHPPKLVITHGVERSVHLAPTQNMTHLQKLTDQILASNKPDKEGSHRKSPHTSPVIMTPCYTAEFGQFTKLVREGGNIVYFCQLCNWKSQVKMQFQAHCSSSHHTSKVKAADQTDLDDSGVAMPLDSNGQILKSEKRSSEYKEPVGWTPRGHLSFLTESSGFRIGNSLPKMEKEYGNSKEKENATKNEGKMRDETNTMEKVNYSNFEKKCDEKMEVEMEEEDVGEDKEERVEKRTNKVDDQDRKDDKEMVQVKQNKRKRAVPVVLRNQADCEEGWDSDECDNDSDVSLGSTHRPGSGNKRRLLEKTRDPDGGRQGQQSSRKQGDMTFPADQGKDRFYSRGMLEEEYESWSPNTDDKPVTCNRSPNPQGSGLRPTPPPVVNMYPDHTPPLKYSSGGREEEMEKTASMIRQYFESQLGFRGLDRPIKCPSATDWPIPPQTSNRNGERSLSTHNSGYCVRDPAYMYNCSLCEFGCADMSEYRLHFETEHGQVADLDSGDAVSDGRGESWKMWKIKEILPDLICVYPRGNVSRDLLLQKISVILSLPEATQWGPACNKAVREQFPHSLAQRKGKYKKTFFFGVALNEHVQEQEEVSDGEGVTYQPLRDMSQDMEKILGHLHSLVQWTGDLESGVSRDEILELLKGRIEEPDVQHWGVQCNRAIRVLFPNVEMKRKGKYKTTVFFGVDFRQDIHKQAFLPNKRGRPRKFPYFDPIQQVDQPNMTWLEALRSSQEELYPQDISSEGQVSRPDKGTVTRGWGPSLGDKDSDKSKMISADKSDEGGRHLSDKFGEYSPFLRYRKQDERRGLDLSLGDKHERSSLGIKHDSFLSICDQPRPWNVPSSIDNFNRSGMFGSELRDGHIQSLLHPLPPSSLQPPGHLDPTLLYRLRSWQWSPSEEDAEDPGEDEEEYDAADGDDEDSNASVSSITESRSQRHERSQRLKHRNGGKRIEKTDPKSLSKCQQFKPVNKSCSIEEQHQSKGDNLVSPSQVCFTQLENNQENVKDNVTGKETSSDVQNEVLSNLTCTGDSSILNAKNTPEGSSHACGNGDVNLSNQTLQKDDKINQD
ncbi:uncharacterized protein LOC132548205 [Ylistrum balloti]|uniref:uncharacterized protein LOC132548205 n=1 Tax=Ylistrum balloti TaxID=509963 RepID=UPI002905E0AD|nr:uncharacterized protein LOC132548205 [Ylistrum balloti]